MLNSACNLGNTIGNTIMFFVIDLIGYEKTVIIGILYGIIYFFCMSNKVINLGLKDNEEFKINYRETKDDKKEK